MKRIMIVLLSFALAGGGGITIKAYAASSGSHSATKCQHIDEYTCTDWYEDECSGGTTEPCPGGSTTTVTCENFLHCDHTGFDGDEEYCDECGKRIHWSGGSYSCSECGAHGSSGSQSWPHGTVDVPCEHGNMSSHTEKYECEHGYTRDHDQTDYHNCSSSWPCQNGHSSYRTVNHYYCDEHNYVGTSSTCPGLTVNPSPSPMSLYVGQSKTLRANQQPSSADASFSSNNSGIARVSSYGTVTGVKSGKTSIVVTATL